MSNEALLLIFTILQGLMAFSTSRSTASTASVGALTEVIGTLRTEVKEIGKQRKNDLDAWKAREKELEEEIRKLNDERRRDTIYIQTLIAVLNEHKLPIPEYRDDL